MAAAFLTAVDTENRCCPSPGTIIPEAFDSAHVNAFQRMMRSSHGMVGLLKPLLVIHLILLSGN